ncbi:HAMP domain-containing sensor histidine kinase [Thalassovita sp.]|uniref:sensor histidine kinase n=1 Tax=Thalassovita sp. TaxID=1979401 RepID=UPI0029DE8022|nr:HAMP domain-containing sensor histidine kinase [Thalassovita sp.]
MASAESIGFEALDGVIQTASVLPFEISPTTGILLLFSAVLSVRAFVPPRPFIADGGTGQPASHPTAAAGRRRNSLSGLRETVSQVAAPKASPAPATEGAQSHRLLQGAFTALLDEVFVFDPETFELSFLNARAEKRVKTLPKQKSALRFPEILPERNRQVVIDAARNLQRSSLDSIVFELTVEDTPLELTLKLIREGDEAEHFMAILRDVTNRATEARAQADYVATLSHEMRTPLTSIKGAVDLIASGKLGELSSPATMTLGVAQRNVDRLLRLTNDILDLEKMDAGKMNCELEPVRLNALVADAVQDMLGYARQFDVTVDARTDGTGALVMADRSRLLQVMANLLSNAIKFSEPGSTVSISIDESQDRLRVNIRDAGPGIPEALQENLFEPYLQGPQVQRKVASSGLGLSIAKRIVEAHSGSIGFNSRPGDGSTFFFSLPKADQAEEAAA